MEGMFSSGHPYTELDYAAVKRGGTRGGEIKAKIKAKCSLLAATVRSQQHPNIDPPISKQFPPKTILLQK